MKTKPQLTQAELKSQLHYDPETGIFTWLSSGSGRNADGVAGCIFTGESGKKYIIIGINWKQYLAHRLAFLYMTGKFPPKQTDHKDGNGLHNWWSNLRAVTNKENQKNQRLRSTNTSDFTGVCWHRASEKWRVQIGKKHVGLFTCKLEAIAVRQAAQIDHGYHPNHGQPRPL